VASSSKPCEQLAFALDVPTLREADALIELLGESVGVFKVGLELFTAHGPDAVRAVHARGRKCFLDLKVHDIPATVARSVQSAADLGAAFLTLHAACGPQGLREAARAANGSALRLLAVTVLTSMDDEALAAIGMPTPASHAVDRLADLAWASGVQGFVCSPAECGALRKRLGPSAYLVTPGVRPAGAKLGDQRRVATPGTAIADGASLLVVGRPIRDAADPRAAAAAIAAEIERART
jgi:orotidine-5'-phosphate decarboxylase